MRRALTVLAALGALVVCAWFALGVRQSDALNHAEAIVGTAPSSITPSAAAHARSLLREAGELNPDRSVTLERAIVDLDEHRGAAARSLAERVTRAEPQNLQAWVVLASTASHDLPLFRETLRRVDALEPRRP